MKEVGSILKNLDPSKSPGSGSRLLKDVASEISCPITDIFNKTLNSGIFPTKGKDSNLTPVFKSGQKDVVKDVASDLRFVHISRCAIKIPEEIV